MGILTNTMIAAAMSSYMGSADITTVGVEINDGSLQGCSTSGELAPAGPLEPGVGVWVREPDLGGQFDEHGNPPCTAEGNLYPADEPAERLCTVGPDGLNVGKGPFSGPNEEAATIWRGEGGICELREHQEPNGNGNQRPSGKGPNDPNWGNPYLGS